MQKKQIFSLVSIFISAAIISQIVIGGIFLPVKQANAFVCPDAPSNIFKQIWEMGPKQVWEFARDTYTKISQYEIIKGVKLGNIISGAKNIYDKVKPYVEKIGKVAWGVLRKKLLDELVNSIIKNIQGENGTPKFVTDWKQFLRDAGNQAAGQFIEEDPDLAFLCDNFGTEIKIALGAVPPFRGEIGCTLDDVINNLEDFYDDMRKGGGWNGWLKVSESQNNVFGAYWTVMGEKLAKETRAKEAATNEAVSGSGFLGSKQCLKWENCNEDLYKSFKNSGNSEYKSREASCDCAREGIATPGKILADTASKAMGSDIDGILTAKEFSEYAGAIFDAAFNRMAREGLAMMQTDDYAPSKSSNQIYNDLMKQLNDEEDMINKISSGQLYGENAAIDISERKGQRELLIKFRSTLRTLKRDIKKAVEYLRDQEVRLAYLTRCANSKYDLCIKHAIEKTSDLSQEICGSIKSDCLSEKAAACAEEKKNCKNLALESCDSKEISCNQVGIQECNNKDANCNSIAKKIILDGNLKYVCNEEASSPYDERSILDNKEIATNFKDYLNTREELLELERIFVLLQPDVDLANNLLQKLENYKPFDECGEKFCASEDNAEECRKLAWYDPAKKNVFLNEKCGIIPDDQIQKCEIQWGCSGIYDSEEKIKCEQDQEKIAKKLSCEKNWENECKIEWGDALSQTVEDSGAKKELFGLCFTQKAFVVSDSYEEFTKNLDSVIRINCGESPLPECSRKTYDQINDPLNKCVWEKTPDCEKNTGKTKTQCYIDLTAFAGGECYDYQYKNITYSELINTSATKITGDDMENIVEIQEKKYSEYSDVSAKLEQKVKSMQRGTEQCYDGSSIPASTINEFELNQRCIVAAMSKCAPIALTGDALDYMRGTKSKWHGLGSEIKFRFPHPIGWEWESFWRGCWRCTATRNCSGDLAGCATWWESKDSVSPYQIPIQSAAKIDIWNRPGSNKYWPNTSWRDLFNLSVDKDDNGYLDIDDIKNDIKDDLESGNLEAILNQEELLYQSSQIQQYNTGGTLEPEISACCGN